MFFFFHNFSFLNSMTDFRFTIQRKKRWWTFGRRKKNKCLWKFVLWNGKFWRTIFIFSSLIVADCLWHNKNSLLFFITWFLFYIFSCKSLQQLHPTVCFIFSTYNSLNIQRNSVCLCVIDFLKIFLMSSSSFNRG